MTVVTPDVEAVKTDGEGVGEGSEGSEGAAEVAEAAGHGGEDEDVKQETGEDGASEDTGELEAEGWACGKEGRAVGYLFFTPII